MELLKVGKDLYLPNCYPSEAKNGVLEYFIYGKGWKKTKKYSIVEGVVLPERYEVLSWFEIAKLFYQYGIEVANQYAENKTAGIVSRQTARGYGYIYAKIKHALPDNFDNSFFDCLKVDYMMACMGLFLFDIISTEKRMAELDGEYDAVNCKYKGKRNVSMRDFINMKWGNNYVLLMDLLNVGALNPEVK